MANDKPGYRTTEFWLTFIMALGSMIGQLVGVIPEPWGTFISVFLTAAYIAARTSLKMKNGG